MSDEMLVILVLAVALPVIALCIFLAYRVAYKTCQAELPEALEKIFGPLFNRFNGRITPHFSRLRTKPVFTGSCNGHKFLLEPYGLNIRDPDHFILTLMLPRKSGMRIIIFKKDPGPIFLVKKVPLSTANFEHQLHVYSNKPSEAKLFFENHTYRDAINKLIKDGWVTGGDLPASLNIGQESISIGHSYAPSTLAPKPLLATLENLMVLADGLH